MAITPELTSWQRARLDELLSPLPGQSATNRSRQARARRRDEEHDEQVAVIRWAEIHSARFAVLRLLYAIPNGGHRNKVTAARLKAEGVRRGVPDLCLPVARGPYHGLYVEMKAEKGRVKPEQAVWHSALRDEWYHVAVCFGAEEAQRAIADYLGMSGTATSAL